MYPIDQLYKNIKVHKIGQIVELEECKLIYNIIYRQTIKTKIYLVKTSDYGYRTNVSKNSVINIVIVFYNSLQSELNNIEKLVHFSR